MNNMHSGAELNPQSQLNSHHVQSALNFAAHSMHHNHNNNQHHHYAHLNQQHLNITQHQPLSSIQQHSHQQQQHLPASQLSHHDLGQHADAETMNQTAAYNDLYLGTATAHHHHQHQQLGFEQHQSSPAAAPTPADHYQHHQYQAPSTPTTNSPASSLSQSHQHSLAGHHQHSQVAGHAHPAQQQSHRFHSHAQPAYNDKYPQPHQSQPAPSLHHNHGHQHHQLHFQQQPALGHPPAQHAHYYGGHAQAAGSRPEHQHQQHQQHAPAYYHGQQHGHYLASCNSSASSSPMQQPGHHSHASGTPSARAGQQAQLTCRVGALSAEQLALESQLAQPAELNGSTPTTMTTSDGASPFSSSLSPANSSPAGLGSLAPATSLESLARLSGANESPLRLIRASSTTTATTPSSASSLLGSAPNRQWQCAAKSGGPAPPLPSSTAPSSATTPTTPTSATQTSSHVRSSHQFSAMETPTSTRPAGQDYCANDSGGSVARLPPIDTHANIALSQTIKMLNPYKKSQQHHQISTPTTLNKLELNNKATTTSAPITKATSISKSSHVEPASRPHVSLNLSTNTASHGNPINSHHQQNATNTNANSNSNNSNNNSISGRAKRLRTSFKHAQLKHMRSWFHKNQNPDAKDLKVLAQATGLTKRVLQVWFQNARAKYRRQTSKKEPVLAILAPSQSQAQQQQQQQHNIQPQQREASTLSLDYSQHCVQPDEVINMSTQHPHPSVHFQFPHQDHNNDNNLHQHQHHPHPHPFGQHHQLDNQNNILINDQHAAETLNPHHHANQQHHHVAGSQHYLVAANQTTYQHQDYGETNNNIPTTNLHANTYSNADNNITALTKQTTNSEQSSLPIDLINININNIDNNHYHNHHHQNTYSGVNARTFIPLTHTHTPPTRTSSSIVNLQQHQHINSMENVKDTIPHDGSQTPISDSNQAINNNVNNEPNDDQEDEEVAEDDDDNDDDNDDDDDDAADADDDNDDVDDRHHNDHENSSSMLNRTEHNDIESVNKLAVSKYRESNIELDTDPVKGEATGVVGED